jgi:hypothetical protein
MKTFLVAAIVLNLVSSPLNGWSAPKGGKPSKGTTSPEPAPEPGPEGCGSSGKHLRAVKVSTFTQLSSAISSAQPGDLIEMADGVYKGKIRSSLSGTKENPITLCGSKQAVLTLERIDSDYVIYVQGSHWVLEGFTVTNAKQGVRFAYGGHNVIRNLLIYNLGQEAISLKGFSSYNRIEGNHIHDIGKAAPMYGEGVYIGTAESQQCQWSNCGFDHSDHNVVINNIIGPNVTAQHVEVKKGSSHNQISGNKFYGAGMVDYSGSANYAWVKVAGNNCVISNNEGHDSPVGNGISIESSDDGVWGNNNLVNENKLYVNGPGFGIKVSKKVRATTTVKCNNIVEGAALGFSNTNCSQ